MKGYTLIEILVGITIIGLIFGFGFVSFREFSRRQSLQGIAKNIKGDLRLAQEYALAGKKPNDQNEHYIHCAPPNLLGGYKFTVSGSGDYTIEASCTGGDATIKEVILPTDVTVEAPTINPILFKSLGQGTNIPTGDYVTITLTQLGTGSQTTINVYSSGDIK